MSKRYQIKAGLTIVTIPGVGVVTPGMIIEGDYDRFVPGKLMLAPSQAAPAPKAKPAPAPTPAPTPAPAPTEPITETEEVDEDLDVELPDMSWRKDDIVEFAASLELDTSGTKREILDRVHAFLSEDAE